MLSELNTLIAGVLQAWHENWGILAISVLLLWVIQMFNALVGYRLCVLGIYPRSWHGLIGILFSPLLHGSTQHLFMNTIPGVVLAALVILNGQETLLGVTLVIVLGGGFLVWLFGRPCIHIGASGVVMGYWGYLLVAAYHHPTMLSILMGVLCFYYFSEMASNIVPESASTSWEGHLFGLISGGGAALLIPAQSDLFF